MQMTLTWKLIEVVTKRSLPILISAAICLDFGVASIHADAAEDVASDSTADVTSIELAAKIDGYIAAAWNTSSVVPAERASDAEFARRVYLDLLGRIPKVAEIRRFLNDSDPDKRAALIDDLFARPAFAAHFATVLRGVLMPRTRENPEIYHLGLSLDDWLRPRVQQQVGYDQIIHQLLTAPLGEHDRTGRLAGDAVDDFGAVAWYQINDLKPENIAGAASRQLLGLKLECAQCHNHPFDTWSQDQFWQTAAFFNQLNIRPTDQAQNSIKLVSISIPGKERVVQAQFLNGNSLEDTSIDPREAFAVWLTSKENKYFAQATSNRIWEVLMGRGIVSPSDDFRPDNPPSHPELLDELSSALKDHDFDLRFLIRAIMLSDSYQRTSAVSHPSQLEPTYYARMQERPLTAEQLWSSLVVATGYTDPVPLTHRGIAGMDTSPRIQFLISFLGESRPDSPQISILHSLKLLHGNFINHSTSGETGSMVVAVSSSPFLTNNSRIETLYLAAFSRFPSDTELAIALSHLDSAEEPGQGCGDVLWALINTSEFMLNH